MRKMRERKEVALARKKSKGTQKMWNGKRARLSMVVWPD
jgi:hypothetical protein